MAPEPEGVALDAADPGPPRRTRLAAERTLLAWWRTGLTALAVGVGVGRIVPEIGDATHTWPYAVLGILFAVYGIALMAVGSRRLFVVDRALARGDYAQLGASTIALMTGGAILLSILTAVVIAVG